LARKAIKLDQVDARGFAELGFAHLYRKQLDKSLSDYSRALTLNPNDADIITECGDCLVYPGQPEKSLPLLAKSMQLNPHYPDWNAYWTHGRAADVISTIRRMQDPSEGRRLLAVSFSELGIVGEARAQARLILQRHPHFRVIEWALRPPHRDQAVIEKIAEGLRKAGLPE
jgi:tetratricopeptide (TPR) repeat protein